MGVLQKSLVNLAYSTIFFSTAVVYFFTSETTSFDPAFSHIVFFNFTHYFSIFVYGSLFLTWGSDFGFVVCYMLHHIPFLLPNAVVFIAASALLRIIQIVGYSFLSICIMREKPITFLGKFQIFWLLSIVFVYSIDIKTTFLIMKKVSYIQTQNQEQFNKFY